MKTLDITVTKASTFNTGNFGNVRPEVTLTLKNVPVENLMAEYTKLLDVCNAMFAINTLELMDEAETVNTVGFKVYLEALRQNEREMEEIIERYQNASE